ncbi:hypothetical protein [Gordonia hydrophobica]|uniref:Uncharacterized protein n=1 Tax=Gordonia hydrophobica TaxID=40516 RepID=A0ABZ2U112_9ACTN|nr:hypothetical protein [Gordonia hydrophobica]MBM7368423.1 hypothetical protein [Gordonia hydrophobica]
MPDHRDAAQAVPFGDLDELVVRDAEAESTVQRRERCREVTRRRHVDGRPRHGRHGQAVDDDDFVVGESDMDVALSSAAAAGRSRLGAKRPERRRSRRLQP